MHKEIKFIKKEPFGNDMQYMPRSQDVEDAWAYILHWQAVFAASSVFAAYVKIT